MHLTRATAAGPQLAAIVGFPKCGTSALIRALGACDGVELLVRPDGELEVSWPLIKALEASATRRDRSGPDILLHKFGAYIYVNEALDHLALTPSRRFILCIRNPRKALVSWINMHRRIAADDRAATHFTHRNREFYLNCSLSAYYDTFARQKLRYDLHFQNLVKRAGAERVLVISQEKMAESMPNVVQVCRHFMHGEPIFKPNTQPCPEERHVSFADRSDEDVSPEIREELTEIQRRLHTLIQEAGVASYV